LHDIDTGLVLFGFRDYDPDVGRWTAKDPILFHGADTDLYSYCLNDPINRIDSWGLIWVTTDIDYHGASNWARGILMYIAELIGVGMDPIAPGPDSFVGAKRTVTQRWESDPENPCLDSRYSIGTVRRFEQTYMKHMRGPNDLTDNHPEPFYYQWHPYVKERTYVEVPDATIIDRTLYIRDAK